MKAVSLVFAVMFFVMLPAQAFDYRQCVRDIQSRSPSIQERHIEDACGAKSQHSGRGGALASAYYGMAGAYRKSELLSSDDIDPVLDRYLESDSYQSHLTGALKWQFNAGKFTVSVFSSASPECRQGYSPIRPTQGSGTRHLYYRRTSPHQQSHHELAHYFHVKSVLCSKR